MSVSADTITLASINPGLTNDFTVFAPTNDAGTLYFAGVFNTTDNGGPTFVSYCVDLYHDQGVSQSWSASQSGSLNDPTNPIITSSNPNVTTSQELAYLFNTNGVAAATSNVGAAALQIALWAVEYDGPNVATSNGPGTYSIGGPSDVFQIAGNGSDGNSAITAAIGFINDLHTALATNPSLVALQTATFFVVDDHASTGTAYQDLITGSGPAFAPFAVPEPSSLVLMAIGGLGAVAFRIRKARRDA